MTRDHSVILETVRRTDSIGERQLNSYKWEGVKQANTEALIIKQKKNHILHNPRICQFIGIITSYKVTIHILSNYRT